jgi:phosphoglycolate phosphatase
MLLDLMEQLGATPEQMVMIGDTEYDVEMARHAGVLPLGVSWGVHEPARLKAAGAVRCFDRLSEIDIYLEGHFGRPQSRF